MERHTLSFSIPNLITVWIMLALGFFALALGTQLVGKYSAPKRQANNAGSY